MNRATEQARQPAGAPSGLSPQAVSSEAAHQAQDALKPCPFCGARAERITIGDDEPNNAGGDVIFCTRCQASGHVEFGRKENLVNRWNSRAEVSEMPAEPDLLFELVDLVDWLDANRRSIEGEFSMDELLSGARAAIAKARGGVA